MKYIILSFDDGRKDNYDVAYKMLKKHNFTASIHITTGLIDGTIINQPDNPLSDYKPLSIENILEMHHCGFDISSHGDMHTNTEDDIKSGLEKLKMWGLPQNNLFSSPNSEIYEGNINEYSGILLKNGIKYVRSGVQIRRNGIFYCILYIITMLTRSSIFFYFLNKNNILNSNLENTGGGGGGLKL
jgi:hypothetical protein